MYVQTKRFFFPDKKTKTITYRETNDKTMLKKWTLSYFLVCFFSLTLTRTQRYGKMYQKKLFVVSDQKFSTYGNVNTRYRRFQSCFHELFVNSENKQTKKTKTKKIIINVLRKFFGVRDRIVGDFARKLPSDFPFNEI